MGYLVLARKYRPRRFQDMVGQEHTLRILTNALEQKRIHHAYLFTGTRGVGKTTSARILAKCLNCELGITSTPCTTCAACRGIDSGQFLDLYEVDAASRTKVEDTRELLENVLYPPSQGRYKIYLIDEVHMLSNHSFNALLKTLEEPPEHVKFLLATTDPKRLPITILSRCLQFHLKRITPEQIASHLKSICEVEGIPYQATALEKLAKAADGSMRDALSLLDQAIAYGQGKVNADEMDTMLGNMAQDDLMPLLEALAAQDGKKLFSVIRILAERAPDFHQVLEEIINIFHQIAITQIVPDAKVISDHVASLAPCFAPEDVQVYYQIALLGRRDLALASSPQQGFEMAMLRMLAFKPALSENTTSTAPRPSQVENTIINKKPVAAVQNKPEPKEEAVLSGPQHTNAETEKEKIFTPEHESLDWRILLPKLELSGMAYALASNCTLASLSEQTIELVLSDSHKPMLNQKLKDRIEEALSRYFNRKMALKINITKDSLLTPLKQEQHEQKQHLEQATQIMMEDPTVKKLIETYDATVEVSIL